MVINRNFLAVVEESREIVDLKKSSKVLGGKLRNVFRKIDKIQIWEGHFSF